MAQANGETTLQQRLEIVERAQGGESDAKIAQALSYSMWTGNYSALLRSCLSRQKEEEGGGFEGGEAALEPPISPFFERGPLLGRTA